MSKVYNLKSIQALCKEALEENKLCPTYVEQNRLDNLEEVYGPDFQIQLDDDKAVPFEICLKSSFLCAFLQARSDW